MLLYLPDKVVPGYLIITPYSIYIITKKKPTSFVLDFISIFVSLVDLPCYLTFYLKTT